MAQPFRYVVQSGRLVGQAWTPPPLRPGQVLVEVHGIGVNRADLLQVKGLYPPPAGYDDVPGLEFSGRVVDAARTNRWRTGDRVMGLVAAGAYASHVVVDERHLWAVPSLLRDTEAAAVPEALATAYLNLVWRGKLRPSEWVLVHSAAGGIGSTAVQLIRLLGGRSVGMVGSDHKAQVVQKLGAHHVFNRKEDRRQLQKRLGTLVPNGMSLILDTVGPGWEAFHAAVSAPGGQWLLIGLLGRLSESETFPWSRFLQKELVMKASRLRNKPPEFKASLMAEIADTVLPAYSEGWMRPVVDSVLPLDQWTTAFEKLKKGDVIGKIVLQP